MVEGSELAGGASLPKASLTTEAKIAWVGPAKRRPICVQSGKARFSDDEELDIVVSDGEFMLTRGKR